eukprot:m51a1_g9271 hypothetical protein (929) ;mRNA; f:86098-91181
MKVVALLFAAVAAVLAVPAIPGPHDLGLPDGSTLRVWATGDEFTGPRYVDAEGRHVLIHEDGAVSYMEADGLPGAPLMSRRHAQQQSKYSAVHLPDEVELEVEQRRARFNQQLQMSASKRAKALPTEPLLFVLVQYPDFPSKPGIREHIMRAVFNESSAAGDTLNSYYLFNSKGKFKFTQAAETSDVANDGVVGPITIDCPWLNHSTWGVYPDYSCLQKKGLLAAAPFVDFKSFDTDGNKVLTSAELHVVLVIAGGDMGALSPPSAAFKCPHVWGFMQPGADCKVTAQGITYGEHVVIGENWGPNCNTPFGIGTLAHELAHTMTVPDLYSLDKGESIMGPWCLMDGGNWNNHGYNPGMMSPFVREYLGWLTPTKVTDKTAIALKPTSVDPDQVLQFGENPNGVDWEWQVHTGVGEYFLVENRERVGIDSYLTGGGVLVWHINENAPIESSRLSSPTLVERIQRKNQEIQSTRRYLDDVLTDSARASIYCSANMLPNTLFDNESQSCVSLSASVDTTTGIATIEPFTDTGCSSCVVGAGGKPLPAVEYSLSEVFGFSFISISDATPITFYSGFASTRLPFAFPFAGSTASYTDMFISDNGYLNFVSLNTGDNGAGKFPVIAPFAGEPAADAVLMKSTTCAAPFTAGPCFVVQWKRGSMTFQAVLSRTGDIHFVFLGNKTGNYRTFVSLGQGVSTDAKTCVNTPTLYSWTDPSTTPAALYLTQKTAGLISLPWSDTLDTTPASASWYQILGGKVSDACGSASGKALTFDATNGLNRFATPYGINVSYCAEVALSFVTGPSTTSTGCSPVAGGIFFGYSFGSRSPSWVWHRSGTTEMNITVPWGSQKLFLAWNWLNGEGMTYIDNVNVVCTSSRSGAATSSASGGASADSKASAPSGSASTKSEATASSGKTVQSSQSFASGNEISNSASG